ncbi:hypothetical protein SELMODRAFT_115849 [Selaginella moellendorffii]|uniref:Uncharacterized protein ABH1-1 n=1 Tax=Selaginella moellendorffii TaxID=88036 RepID=D8SFU6_SELML|nr:hypothetical protein SELMODRAFT_115849 [Selaginella moellendorffii]
MGSSEADASWRGYVIRIGDRCPEYGQAEADEHIETCSMVIARDLRQYEDEILDVLIQCAEELPHKLPFYGAVVGLTNIEEANFVSRIVERVHSRLQDALNTEDCNRLRILLRFLAVLMCNNVISSTSLVEVFETLLSSAATTVDEEVGNPAWQPRADFYVSCILSSLPWCGFELQERAPEELERVMAAVEAYFSLRMQRPDSLLTPFYVDSSGTSPITGQDYVQEFWSRTQQLQQAGWKADSVPRPYASFESRLVTSQTLHQLKALACPAIPKPHTGPKDLAFGRQTHEAETKYPQRTGRLRVFPPENSEKDMAPIDCFIVEEYLLDIMLYLNGSRKECAAFMVGLPVPFRYDYLMAEVVFGQMLLLPKPPFKLIYYTIVIIDLCKALPGSFPGLLAAVVRNLFSRISELDVECRSRLSTWLSHHMSNFQFIWPWSDFAHVAEQPAWSPQRVFVQETLEKEVRLSYWERLFSPVKSEWQSLDDSPKLCDLLPPKNTPEFRFSRDNQVEGLETETGFASELLAQIKTKKGMKDIESWFESKIVPAAGQKVAIEILLQTLLNLGSKSFTHMVTVLERYGQLIATLAPDETLQVHVIDEVARFWQNSSQMIAIVVDRMMGYRLVSNLAVIRWSFKDENVQTFHTSGRVWELLGNAINKAGNRTADLQRDVVNAKRALDEADGAVSKAERNRSNVQELIDSAETDDARKQATSKMEWVKTTVVKARGRQTAAQDLLETKEALLSGALREQDTLVCLVFQNLVSTISSKLSKSDADGADTAEPEPMDVDADPSAAATEGNNNENNENQNERYKKSHWQRCTMGHLEAFCRQYAAEVWQMIEKLDQEVFTENANQEVIKVVYSAIKRPILDKN